jgi:hypothetical protein
MAISCQFKKKLGCSSMAGKFSLKTIKFINISWMQRQFSPASLDFIQNNIIMLIIHLTRKHIYNATNTIYDIISILLKV